MGLDTSHDCWHGAYSAFMTWRRMIAKVAGLPPLDLMEGFYTDNGLPTGDPFWMRGRMDEVQGHSINQLRESLPIRWEALKPDPLHWLLNHSDCEGEIPPHQCGPIADRLEELLPLLPNSDHPGHIGSWRDKTSKFIVGLRDAASKGEAVDFH